MEFLIDIVNINIVTSTNKMNDSPTIDREGGVEDKSTERITRTMELETSTGQTQRISDNDDGIHSIWFTKVLCSRRLWILGPSHPPTFDRSESFCLTSFDEKNVYYRRVLISCNKVLHEINARW